MSKNDIYSKCYYHLFNAVSDQIMALEELAQRPGEPALQQELKFIVAKLKAAQCETEELYVIGKV